MDYNAGDEKQVKAAAKQLEIAREQELEDIKSILNTKAGRRFFKRFFEKGFMFKSTFTGNSQTFFKEGHRNLALEFFGDICEAAPERIPELIINKL